MGVAALQKMSTRNLIIIAVVLLAILLGNYLINRPTGVPSSEIIDVMQDPIQTDLTLNEAQPFTIDDGTTVWMLTPKAHYSIAGRVLHTKHYTFLDQDLVGKLAPADIGLGWGQLSDPAVDKSVDWYETGRFIQPVFDHLPVDETYFYTHFSHTHLIPADKNIKKALFALSKNQDVLLEGLLVYVDGPNGEKWHSSLTRTDMGNGACEIMYVQKVVVDGEEYE